MKIGFDVDGILADFSSSYRRKLISVTGRTLVTVEEALNPTTWYWERAAGYTKPEEDAVWKQIEDSGSFWYELGALSGVRTLLARPRLQYDHDLYFITSRSGQDAKFQTENWLMANCGIGLPTVLISSEKGLCAAALKLDVYIDDRDKNAVNVFLHSPHTRNYLLDYQYNKSVMPHEARRVQSVAEMFELEKL